MPKQITPLSIPEVKLIKPDIYHDNRGHFFEGCRAIDLPSYGIEDDFVQDNYSISHQYVLRGLHYQREPYAQAKLITCLSGTIYDVAVDMRIGSPTYGQHISAYLTDTEHELLYIPAGFAHGFLALSERVVVHYRVSGVYHPEADGGVDPLDPALAIDWPLDGHSPILSAKDQNHPYLADIDAGFVYQG